MVYCPIHFKYLHGHNAKHKHANPKNYDIRDQDPCHWMQQYLKNEIEAHKTHSKTILPHCIGYLKKIYSVALTVLKINPKRK